MDTPENITFMQAAHEGANYLYKENIWIDTKVYSPELYHYNIENNKTRLINNRKITS